MSSLPKKRYFSHKNAPLTRYAITKARKAVKEEAEQADQNTASCSDEPDQEICEAFLDAGPAHESSFDESVRSNFDESVDTGLSNDDDDKIDPLYEDLYSDDEELLSMFRERSKPRNSFAELLNDKKFFELMSLNTERSPAELLLIALIYSHSNSLPMTAIVNLFKFVNILCGKLILTEGKHNIDKLCSAADNVTLHGACPTCFKYIGTFEDFNAVINCENCNMQVDMSNPSSRCFFAMINPSDAIRDSLQNNEDYYTYVVKDRKHDKNHLKDIYDGALYRKFLQGLKDCDRNAYATVIFNTDGAAVFESSKYSIWPIYLILNEIPIQNRFNNVITAGLWFGLNKPEMSVFLEAFVNMMNHFSTVGIPCMIKNEEMHIKIYALLACVDTVARAPMQGSSQFNANYGCDWCLHEGQYYQGSMRYPFKYPLPKLRDHVTTIEHATKAVWTDTNVFGIKTASPLLNLCMFDIIEGFVPDYMHCFVAGAAKSITELIIKYLTKTDVEKIDNLLKNMKSPHQIGRLSRPLSQRRFWKAREYENWVLYYSIPTLSSVLTQRRILRHWTLLVDALHICLQTDITFAELNRANEMLHKFVSEVEDLYMLNALTYNVHQLLHLATSVYNWGPLYSHSTYPFEAANHKLLKAIHSAKGVISQIVRYENIQRFTQLLETTIYPDCPEIVSRYCENLKTTLNKKAFKLSSITYLGKEQPVSDDVVETFGILRNAKVFKKIIFCGCLFTSSRKENRRSCNYFAQLTNGNFVKLLDFTVQKEHNQELTVCQLIKTKFNKYSSFIKEILEFSDKICVETKQISKTCIYIEIERNMYIIPVPNQLFY